MAAGRRLACACEVQGDLLLVVPEESQARKQIVAKAATDRAIDIAPAVRQVYVEVEAATLESHGGDWERLAGRHWRGSGGLRDLSIDLQGPARPAAGAGGRRPHADRHALAGREVLRVQPGYSEGVYGLAVDVGSTTIAAHLCDLRTGAVKATASSMNPQVRFGEDLMSRVSYVMMHPDALRRCTTP